MAFDSFKAGSLVDIPELDVFEGSDGADGAAGHRAVGDFPHFADGGDALETGRRLLGPNKKGMRSGCSEPGAQSACAENSERLFEVVGEYCEGHVRSGAPASSQQEPGLLEDPVLQFGERPFNRHAAQSHPLVPTLQVSSGGDSSSETDLNLPAGNSTAAAHAISQLLAQVFSGEYTPRAQADGLVDFQMTRGWLGVST